MLVSAVIALVIACVASSALTLLVYKTAPRFELTDKPDNHRKLHARPTALGGGLAVFLATSIVLVGLLVLPTAFRSVLQEHWTELLALPLAGALIVIVGLADDRIGLRGRQKLAGQIAAASIVIAGGLVIREIGIFGQQIALGPLSLPFTLLWLLGAMNALNLLDGLDGLAAMVGIILVSTSGALAVMTGNTQIAIIAFVFAASLLGFMPFNFPPARIFLGDAGSMLIGLVVGTLAIQGSFKGAGTVLLAAPLAIWTIPMFDTGAAVIRRTLAGRSVYVTDRSHLHHRLMDRLGSHLRVLGWVGFTCVLTSAAALISVFLKSDLIAISTCVAVVSIYVVANVFGRGELLLLVSRLRRIGLSLLPRGVRSQAGNSEVSLPARNSQQWDFLWETVRDAAEELDLSQVRVHVRLSMSHSAFDAFWEQPRAADLDRCWQIEVPLFIEDRAAGRLSIVAKRNAKAASEDVQRMLGLIEQIEMQLLNHSGGEVPIPALAERVGGLDPEAGHGNPVLAQKHPK